MDHRTDVYSTGIILFEMLAGRPPFIGPTDFAIQAQHLNDPPPSLRALNPAVPEAVERLILTALEKKPADRFSGCGEFAEALENALRRLRAPSPLPAPRGPERRSQPRAKARTLALGALAILLAALAYSTGNEGPGAGVEGCDPRREDCNDPLPPGITGLRRRLGRIFPLLGNEAS